jgi:hypothetical protein
MEDGKVKTFLAIYLGNANSEATKRWEALDKATQHAKEREAIEAWNAWGETHAASIVENGPPLGKTKFVGPNGIKDTKNDMTGYAIVRADSHDAAAKLFLNHPHFAIFPGAGVEVMEILPMPEMPQ